MTVIDNNLINGSAYLVNLNVIQPETIKNSYQDKLLL